MKVEEFPWACPAFLRGPVELSCHVANHFATLENLHCSLMALAFAEVGLFLKVLAEVAVVLKRLFVLSAGPSSGVRLAKEVAEAGAGVTVITDAQAAVFVESADLVLVGADTITEGEVINKVGSLRQADLLRLQLLYSVSAIAWLNRSQNRRHRRHRSRVCFAVPQVGTYAVTMAARERGVPVYAVADKSKFSPGPVSVVAHEAASTPFEFEEKDAAEIIEGWTGVSTESTSG
jgi:methylthioribose-1-phosphate isomerase